MQHDKYEAIILFLSSEGKSRRVFPQEIEGEVNTATKKSKKANWRTMCKNYSLSRGGVLLKKEPRKEERVDAETGTVARLSVRVLVIVVKEGDTTPILERFHGTYHVGRDPMLEAILREFWWPGIKSAIAEFIQLCGTCAQRSKSTWKTPLRPIIATRPMELWQMDFTGPYLYSIEEGEIVKEKSKMCLLIVDSASKMLWGTIFSTKHCAKVAKFLESCWEYEGVPTRMQADNGGEFVGAEVKELYERRGVKGTINSQNRQVQIQFSDITIKH